MLSKSKIKYIQSLGHKKFREEEKCYVVEGETLVMELIQNAKNNINEIISTKEWIAEKGNSLHGIAFTEALPFQLEKITQLTTAQKVLAVVQQQQPQEINKDGVILVLDEIRDPGNLGTIIRSADWFGIRQVICTKECADVYNPKVVQASMGSIWRVNIHYLDVTKWLQSNIDLQVYAAMLDGKSVLDMQPIHNGVIVVGNESRGVSDSILSFVKNKITIPRIGDAESLNVAVAAGIILSHLVGK